MPRSVCGMCGGSKYVSAETIEQCSSCSGSGKIYNANGSRPCHTCNGKGSKRYIRKVTCSSCSGRGYISY